MATPIRTSIAVLLAGGLAAATLPVALAAANAATTAAPAVTSTTASTASHLAMKKKKPKLTLSDTTLRKGDKVKLTVKRLPKRTTSIYITICGNPPGATNCDTDLSHVKQVSYNGSGKLKTKYKISTTKFRTASGKINCKKKQCVVGTTNAYNPKDHSFNSWAKFRVG